MDPDPTLNIFKSALLLEHRGQAFYRHVAAQSEHAAVKRLFDGMAAEEQVHIDVLTRQFNTYRDTGALTDDEALPAADSAVADTVLSRDIREQVAAAGFEAAAIQAAISMEERATALYRERSRSATLPAEKTVYEWLADWEQGHLDTLVELDRDITRKIWYDNQFWPF